MYNIIICLCTAEKSIDCVGKNILTGNKHRIIPLVLTLQYLTIITDRHDYSIVC
jgi:hypothetical protein